MCLKVYFLHPVISIHVGTEINYQTVETPLSCVIHHREC